MSKSLIIAFLLGVVCIQATRAQDTAGLQRRDLLDAARILSIAIMTSAPDSLPDKESAHGWVYYSVPNFNRLTQDIK